MKFKAFIVSVFFICSLLPGISLAHDKVVVIPLMSDCDAIPTVTSATGRVWMDRNLGASRVAQNVDDYHAYGYLYQWGRLADGHEDRGSGTTTTLSASYVPGHDDFIVVTASPWNWTVPQLDGLWNPTLGINNPCPAGFRVPTETEWETERLSWNSNDLAGAFASPLRLVEAGIRTGIHGFNIEGNANYWSANPLGSQAIYLWIYTGGAWVSSIERTNGMSVRCIKD